LLREQILEATERLLIESGGDEEAVSIRAVADAVGVTPPSIYLHFADKNELIFAVCEQHFTEFDRLLEEAAAGSADPLESLRLRGRAYVRFGVEHPGPYRILFMSKPAVAPDWWTPERVQESASFVHLVGAVQRCIDAGQIAPGDPIQISVAVWAAVHGVTSLLISKSTLPWPDPDGLADYMCNVLIDGLRRGIQQ
jgi:AcrR family transcriptional regulator